MDVVEEEAGNSPSHCVVMLGKIKMKKEQRWLELDSKIRRDEFEEIECKRSGALDGYTKEELIKKLLD